MKEMRPAPPQNFTDLQVWRKAHIHVLATYDFTTQFPKHEVSGLAAQMRRAAISIPASIAEGFRRRGKADKSKLVNVAENSIEESRYYLILARDLGYGDVSQLLASLDEVSRLLQDYAAAGRKTVASAQASSSP
jgi:four helix bundle protein